MTEEATQKKEEEIVMHKKALQAPVLTVTLIESSHNDQFL